MQWSSYIFLAWRGLRSSDSIRLKVPLENGTFQDTAAAFFNNLPGNLKKCDFKLIYLPLVFLKKLLKKRAQSSKYYLHFAFYSYDNCKYFLF